MVIQINSISINCTCVETWLFLYILGPRQNGRYFPDTLNAFFNKNIYILIKCSVRFVHKGQINNIPALFQIMACGLIDAIGG